MKSQLFSGPPELTTRALVQLDAFGKAMPENGITGSIGRHVIMGAYDTPALEPLPIYRQDGSPRDIDSMSLKNFSCQDIPVAAREPLPADDRCNQWLRSEANGAWLVFPEDPSIAEQLDESVFQLVERCVGDLTVRTFSIPTQERLNGGLIGFTRAADRQPFGRFSVFAANIKSSSRILEDRPLVNETYVPFERFTEAIHQKYPLYTFRLRMRDANHRLPPPVRKLITPLRPLVRKGLSSLSGVGG